MAVENSLVVIICCVLAATCSNAATFSSLPRTLTVSASPKHGQVLKAGDDKISVTWSLNTSLSTGTDSSYHTVKVKLCYAPISQQDRAWRKTADDLSKDKTCQHKIVAKPYNTLDSAFTWTIQRDVPGATYFIRAYAYNSTRDEVAYGQTTDQKKTTNLFYIQAISGRHMSLDIASICFSAFAVIALFGFFFFEKRKVVNK
ncbi:high-affinity nitrate transporter 3.1-like [Andrographis paniculata]|uniref:high-affinity nitrate transporter 3.1-like n=1 Tax=Andrographis paniculata TaxID=175694 RepID=UPI0021E8AF7D|nr:high-affinity nitrate transporter 3.1-like [Andrographis paniculata]